MSVTDYLFYFYDNLYGRYCYPRDTAEETGPHQVVLLEFESMSLTFPRSFHLHILTYKVTLKIHSPKPCLTLAHNLSNQLFPHANYFNNFPIHLRKIKSRKATTPLRRFKELFLNSHPLAMWSLEAAS